MDVNLIAFVSDFHDLNFKHLPGGPEKRIKIERENN